MIQSLDDAWKWYTAVKTIAYDMRHLAGIWDEPALETVLSLDNRLRHRTAADLKDAVNTILGTDDEDLNDLAVLVLFSVFEATVRARAKADVDRETALMRHPAVLSAIKNLKDSIENGSFAKITEAYKKMDSDLTTQVNQVRKFRNWVSPMAVVTSLRIVWTPKPRKAGSISTSSGWPSLKRPEKCPRRSRSRVRRSNVP